MNNTHGAYGVLGALLGGVAVWLYLNAGGAPTVPGVGGRQAGSGTGTQRMAQLDAHFIEQMIPHHEDAITMAQLALAQAQRPEITQLAQAIIDSQGKEIDQMKSWYQEWFGRALPTGAAVMQHHGMMSSGNMHMGMMGNDTDSTRLTEAADFDKAFIEAMIPHHQMAVMMASMLQQGTQRPEMQQLAEDIITAQTREIEQMRQWYGAWF